MPNMSPEAARAIARCIAEQRFAAEQLADPAARERYAARHRCTVEQARAGAAMSARDWLIEECLLRSEGKKESHG